ncbi:MAG: hypothetical protein V1763_00625, partial [Parcubacteria group bacterium]
LIANPLFVLVGRGQYAPKDWGLQAGTVADVVEAVLAAAKEPLAKPEIYKQVLAKRKVNPATIYLALLNKERFEKVGEKYGLKK